MNKRFLVKKPKNNALSLKDFYQKRNKVLVNRRVGGLGDILMIRMIFEDFHLVMPEIEITWALPRFYHPIASHPFVKNIIECNDIKRIEFGQIYDITTPCRVHECKFAQNNTKHRSDIWANSCGINLTKHNMHLESSNKINTNTVLFIPTSSAMPEKNLNDKLIKEIVSGLKEKGLEVITLHHQNQPIFENLGIKQYITQNLKEWLKIIDYSEYVISIDTAVFHASGGLGKKTIGIFSFTNGKIYGKYYKNTKIVQGGCPLGYTGCYDWNIICKTNPVMVCKNNIKAKDVVCLI